MNLLDKITEDRINARSIIYNKDLNKSSKLINLNRVIYNCSTLLLGEINTISKNMNIILSDDKILDICKKYLKNLDITFGAINGLNIDNINTIEKIKIEKDYINKLLPNQLTEHEIVKIINDFIIHNNNTNIGIIMKHFKINYNNKYNGKVVSSIIGDIIG